MKKLFLVLYSVFASVVVCAMTESEFDEWKSDTLDYLDSASDHADYVQDRVDNIVESVFETKQLISSRLSSYDSNTQYYGSQINNDLLNIYNSLPAISVSAETYDGLNDLRSALSSAYSQVASVYYGSDLSGITNLLERIRYLTQSIDSKVSLLTNILESANNILTYVQHIDSVIVPASGNNPGYIRTQTTLDLNLDFPLQHYLDGFYDNLSSIWTNTTELSRQFNEDLYPRLYSTQSPNIYDVQQNFKQWYEDTKFASSNSFSWKPWFNPNMFIEGCFFLGEYLDPVIQQLGLTPNSDGGFDLSNEGKLLLYMFGQNERKFLCDLNTSEMVNYLASRTNDFQAVDLSSITNYLYKIQQPFFSSFNSYLKKLDSYTSVASGNWNPYNAGNPVDYNYNIVTQYLVYAGDHVGMENPVNKHFYVTQIRDKFRTFQWRYTNVLERIEIYLMALNGLLPTSSGGVDDLGEMLTTEGASESMFELATNKYGEAVAAFTSTSNSLQSVKTCFENIVNAFDFRESSGSTVDDTAYFSVVHDWCGDFEMPQISLSLQETGLQSVCEYGHRFFRVIWYLLATVGFSTLFFKLAVTGSKAVIRALILISTLLGK